MDETCKYQMADGPCGAPIVPDVSSYSGWRHAHAADWMHWATVVPYGPQGANSGEPRMSKVFRHCAVCGKLPEENPKHLLYVSAGGHHFVAASY